MSTFDKLLKKVSLQEYRAFVSHYATNDPDFRAAFEIYFSEKDENPDLTKKYTKLTRRIISKYSDRGFVDYRSSFALSQEIDNLLQSGVAMANNRNFIDAFLIAKITLKEMIGVITCCDDSAGCIGGSVTGSIELINTIADADNAAPALKEEIYMFLENELHDRIYFDYGDFGYDLFCTYQDLAANLGKGESFLAFVDKQIKQLKADSYSNYEREFLIKQKIRFFQKTNEPEKARQLIDQHLDIVELRKEEVDRALSQNNVEQAKMLIREGIRIAENKDHWGTVAQWEKELLLVAELEKDVSTIRYYAKKFAFDRGFSKEAYNKWKSTYKADEWRQIIEQLIREKTDKITINAEATGFRSCNTMLLMALAPVYIEEQYWDRLMVLVKKEKDLDSTLTYHKYLKKHYSTELLEIYLPAFEKEGDRAGNRKKYATLVAKMKKVLKDIPDGEEKIRAVAQKLRERYSRRPAMLDELDKL